MPSMSYCMFENTASEMGQCLEAMEEAESIEDLDLNEYEKAAFFAMFRICRDFLAEHERLISKEYL